MSKRAEQRAMEAYPRSDFQGVETSRRTKRKCYIAGYEQALSDIKSLIDSNLAPGYAGKIIRLIEQNYE